VGKAREVIDAIAAAATTDPHAMPQTAWLTEAEELLEARNRLDALIAVRLQAGDVRQVTVNECGRTTGSWLVEDHHLSRHDARRRVWLARHLPAQPQVAAAFADGQITAEHAHLIISCLLDLDPAWRDAAREELIRFATEHDPGMLTGLIRAVKTRAGAEEPAEARAQRQFRDRFLALHDTYQGTVRLDGMLDPVSAATLRAALHPLLAAPGGPDDTRTSGQRHADALISLADLSLTVHADPDLTQQAGLAAPAGNVITTIALTELADGIADRQLPTATFNQTIISPNTARMLACDAGIIPAVLGSRSELLDLGRSTRTWSTAQRRAANLRDQGCVFPRCQTGLEHCHLHHLEHWANHGATNHDNSANLCRFHHWLVHHTSWTITRDHTGTIHVRRT
jgi:Domain of unknown function (DUF222)